MLSAVFKSVLPEISISQVLHVLLRSFQAEAPIREVHPPSWDLNIVSSFLRSSSFQPWTTISLRNLTCRPLFLLSLATAKRGVWFRLCHVVFLSLHLLLVCLMCRCWWPRQNLPCGPSLAPLRFHLSGILRRVCLRT